MATRSRLFQIVYDVSPYPAGGCHILIGHKVPADFEDSKEELNGGIFVVNGNGSIFIAQPNISRMYIPCEGRFLTANDLTKFPAPLYLITEDRRFRQIFNGEVVVHMNGPMEEDTEDELTRNEIVNLPIIGEKMIGIVRVSSIASHRAMLIAYSSEIDYLPEEVSDLRSGADESWLPFGSISLILNNPSSEGDPCDLKG